VYCNLIVLTVNLHITLLGFYGIVSVNAG